MKTSMSYKVAISIIFTVFILSSCSDDSGPRNAVYTPLNQLVSSPGFEWFTPEYNAYTPDPVVINQIKAKLQGKNLQFVLFVNPSCACAGTQKQFPAAVKVLQESGIFEPNFKIYTFVTSEDMHPYMSRYSVNSLPCLFPMLDSIPQYSVIDTLNKYAVIDTNSRLENYFLKALN